MTDSLVFFTQGYFFLISQKFLKTFQDFFDDFSNDAISIV